jgi:hypothetical protein
MNQTLRSALALGLISLAGAASALPMVGVTSDNRLIYTDSNNPSIVATTVSITGLQAGETILGIDTRPANGQLFALGSTGRLYRIGNGFDGGTLGGASQIGNGPAFTPYGAGVTYGFDFNPTVDRIRVVGSDSSNFRLNPTVDAATSPFVGVPPGDTALNPATAAIGAAYDQNNSGTTTTTLFLIATSTPADALVMQGSVNGTPNSPNGGVVTNIGSLGVDLPANVGFDISVGTPATATAAVFGGGSLYTVNLATGAATLRGPFANGALVTDITFVPAIPSQTAGQVIPTLSPLTLAALLGALGLLGLVALRRKS